MGILSTLFIYLGTYLHYTLHFYYYKFIIIILFTYYLYLLSYLYEMYLFIAKYVYSLFIYYTIYRMCGASPDIALKTRNTIPLA